MPEDLGTWSRPQAGAVVKVLKRAGVRVSTAAAPDGKAVVVTVPDGQADRAHAALAAEMDTIARAARAEREDRGRRATVRDIDSARRGRKRPASGEGPLVTERLAGLAPVLGLLLVALLVGAVVPGNLRFVAMIVAVLGFVYLLGRRDPGDGG